MKTRKLFLLALLTLPCSLFAQTDVDPVLMTINGNPIQKSEFEYIYNKNNSANSLDKKTLDEYVDLFINFKLKVEEAKAQGIDTTPEFKKEYASYRSQLVKPYLVDKNADEAILKQAYDRIHTEVEASHIYIHVPFNNATPEDTLEAYKKITAAYKRLAKEDFAKVAKAVTEDLSTADKGGYIGWITAFVYMYPYENVLYNTPIGGYSKPTRTQAGYHIVKIHNHRPASGEVRTAHIMTFKSDDEQQNKAAKNKIDSIYTLIQQGEDFEKLARENSEDLGSAMRNGEMPWFTIGRMPTNFENTAFFELEVGGISKPVESPSGWHIIKLLERRGVPSFETIKPELERRIKQDERVFAGRDTLVAKLKKEYNYQYNRENLQEFSDLLGSGNITDSIFIQKISTLDKPLFCFADKEYSQKDLAHHIQLGTYTKRSLRGNIIEDKYNDLVIKELLAYEDSQLENKYDDLRFLSQEYYDGILLFEISNQEIWEKAAKDTKGLEKFFNERKADYLWEAPHYKGRIIYAKDKKKLKEAKSILKKAPENSVDIQLKALNDSVIYIKTEKGLFVQGDNKVIDEKIFKSSVKYEDEAFPYVYIQGKKLNHTPEDYTDVRGVITADYQTYMEQEWIKYLREKYPFTVNQEVLKTVKKN